LVDSTEEGKQLAASSWWPNEEGNDMTREPEWVGSSIDKRLRDLGDRMHDQVTEFDPSNPLRPPRYWFGIDPDDPVSYSLR
jgi:hypothetical protein